MNDSSIHSVGYAPCGVPLPYPPHLQKYILYRSTPHRPTEITYIFQALLYRLSLLSDNSFTLKPLGLLLCPGRQSKQNSLRCAIGPKQEKLRSKIFISIICRLSIQPVADFKLQLFRNFSSSTFCFTGNRVRHLCFFYNFIRRVAACCPST